MGHSTPKYQRLNRRLRNRSEISRRLDGEAEKALKPGSPMDLTPGSGKLNNA